MQNNSHFLQSQASISIKVYYNQSTGELYSAITDGRISDRIMGRSDQKVFHKVGVTLDNSEIVIYRHNGLVNGGQTGIISFNLKMGNKIPNAENYDVNTNL